MSDTPGVPDHAAPTTTEGDARNRALRTFVQGLLLDLVLALVVVLSEAMSADSIDWRLLGLALGKTALMTVVSYVSRKVAPPPVV